MQKNLFESSEYYNKKYNNFSVKVIIPIFLLFLVGLLSLIYIPKNIYIETIGTIIPYNNNYIIETDIEKEITKNYISNGKKVEKGDILVRYSDGTSLLSVESGRIYTDDIQSPTTIFIYPIESDNVIIQSYIPSENLYDINLGQQATFIYDKQVLTGKVESISYVPINLEGSFVYEVKSKFNIDNTNLEELPYMSMGTLKIITEHMSYYDFLLTELIK